MSQDVLRTRVKRLRKLLGWPQGRLAKDARIVRSRISEWEGQLVDLRPDEVARIEQSLRDGLGAKRVELANAERAELSVTA